MTLDISGVSTIGHAWGMPEFVESLELPRLFPMARVHLARATQRRRRGIRLWDEIRAGRPFAAQLHRTGDDTVELWCSFRLAEDRQQEADAIAGELLREIKCAMDAAILAAAAANVGLGILDVEKHAMPLCFDRAHFESLADEGWLMGLRPDQVGVVRDMQPFAADDFVGHHMRHLALALEGSATPGLFTIWAGRAEPKPDLPAGYALARLDIEEPGRLAAAKRLATLRVQPSLPDGAFTGDPNVFFDPILNAPPWPRNPDDNLNNRGNALLAMTRVFVNILEDSVDRTTEATQRLKSVDASIPPEPARLWLPVQFADPGQEGESRKAISESDQGMAIYGNDDGVLTYMAIHDGQVVGREIPNATPLPPGEAYGTEVESATRAAAARWGLPDFVLRPKVVRKGSGIREVGDGTIVSGTRGIALQVKARSIAAADSPERARAWLLKNAGAGLNQARGTIRTTFQSQNVTLENLRGRPVHIAGRHVEWVPVVVLDHPSPPRDVIPPGDGRGPSVVILRRDWEFLWSQLQSASAIVDYIHRVSAEEEPAELGSETHRYLDLADKDLHALPTQLPGWMNSAGVDPSNLPLLPKDPASAPDELGFRVFQRVMEDIARTDFTGDETVRVRTLAHIDRVAVTARAELGRLLLRRMISCGEAPDDEFRVEHRLMYIDQGELHLSFTCMGKLTGVYQELFQSWLLHRRQRFLAQSAARGPLWLWSVGVLLTPSPSESRLWDTTVVATNGPPHFDQAEYERLGAVYDSVAPRGDPDLDQAV